MSSHIRFFFSAALAAVLGVPLAMAGGSFPLPCSQGDEIRTIDHYMDVNMEDLQRINQEDMPEDERQALVDENTQEFLLLQERREELSRDCANEIHARDVFWREQGIDSETPPPAETISLDPPADDAAGQQAPAETSQSAGEAN